MELTCKKYIFCVLENHSYDNFTERFSDTRLIDIKLEFMHDNKNNIHKYT